MYFGSIMLHLLKCQYEYVVKFDINTKSVTNIKYLFDTWWYRFFRTDTITVSIFFMSTESILSFRYVHVLLYLWIFDENLIFITLYFTHSTGSNVGECTDFLL